MGLSSQKELILGLDLGTSSLKGIFCSNSGEIIAKYEVPIALRRNGDCVEQDGQAYLAALQEFVGACTRHPVQKNLLARVVAIGLSGHTPSLIGIDKSGEPTFPVLIWQDNRASQEANLLSENFGDPSLLVGTSLPWTPSGTAAKAMWVARNYPDRDAIARTRWLLQPKDFLGFHLTGAALSDPWSTKGLCNVRTGATLTDLLTFAGWDSRVVPQLLEGLSSRGKTTADCEARFGIPKGIPVSVGWSDAMCGMLALGVFNKPLSFIITGTSAIVGTSTANEPMSDQPLYLIPHGSAPYPVVFGPTQMSGGSISWAANLFSITESELVERGDSDESANVPTFLPYIAGERAPLWRNDIRGLYANISVEHGASAFARSTMEGICFAERQVLELSQKLSNAHVPEVIISGRAGNDPRWIKTRLRTMGQPLRFVDDLEITCRGSAILAHTLLTNELSASTAALTVSGALHTPTPEDIAYGARNYERFLGEQQALLSKVSNATAP